MSSCPAGYRTAFLIPRNIVYKRLVYSVSPVGCPFEQYINWSLTHQSIVRISSRGSYDNTGKTYNVTRIINLDASLNEAEYKAYSPIFLS